MHCSATPFFFVWQPKWFVDVRLMLRKEKKYMCVCVCAHVCVHVHSHACVTARVHARA